MSEYEGYTFVLDVDGTLCPIKRPEERYEDLVPYPEMVERVRWLHDRGAHIVIHSSRNMNSYDGNIGMINKHTAPVMMAWLDRWRIPYDEIVFGKPWPGHKGFYVDDRSLRPDEFLGMDAAGMEAACASSRAEVMGSFARDMAVVVTMAGAGSRFRKAGYDVPKFMIEVRGKSLFEWSMDSLGDYFKHASRVVFVMRAEDRARDYVLSECERLSIPNPQIIELKEQTDGQATSCLMACDLCASEESLMVYNIDTYVEPGELLYSDISGDGHIPCFHAPGDHWSFVKVDSAGEVVEVREKDRISDNCTLGAYWFSSVALYRELYGEYYSDSKHIEKGERYIAPLYNHMISRGEKVTISIVDEQKVHVLGTPEELDEFARLGSC